MPLADMIVQMPGASAAEVENLVTINLEKRCGKSKESSTSTPSRGRGSRW